jgi:predicted nucleotidyltransferase
VASPLASLLFKDYRRRVLGLLLLHPDKQYHVREIARLTGTVAGTLHKELTRLAEAGLLVKETSGNQVYYRANRTCPVFEELASILRKTSGLVDVLADALALLTERITVAFVYGSVARGKETAGSDIDVLLIGDVEFSEVVAALYPAQEVLGREINPKVYSEKEWRQMLKKKDAFMKEVMTGPKLFIIGTADELG